MFTWGGSNNGQLGDGTTINKSIPTNITSRFSLSQGETISAIALGSTHSSALTSIGRVFTWGRNTEGQLGDATTLSRSTPIDITSRISLVQGETISSIVLGSTHSLVLTSNVRMFTWGGNVYGQVGDGTTTNRSTPITLSSNIVENERVITFEYNEVTNYFPVLEGYKFGGWYSDIKLQNLYTITTMPAEDLILYGKWVPAED
jgi:alpha-tubulin suppressor-like RCC1 family protein